MISRGLRWDRWMLERPCDWIAFTLSASFFSTIPRTSGLLCLILATVLAPSWQRRSFTRGRQALSCNRRMLTYLGKLRQIRIALFWIFCIISNVLSGLCRKQTDPYSKIDLTYTLYSLSRVFGSVPPHANILRIFSLFSAF